MNFRKIVLERTESTNDVVYGMYQQFGANTALCVRADYQIAGRGLEQNKWHSSPGQNLLVSLGIKPFFIEPQKQFELTKIVSLALIKTVQGYMPDAQLYIKWPNDIYIQKQKLAGILISNMIQGKMIDYSIIGIGLNVNEKIFPGSIPNPVSMIQMLHKAVAIDEILDVFLSDFNKAVLEFQSNPNDIQQQYLNKLLYFNQLRNYSIDNKIVHGRITGLDLYGHLELQHTGGKVGYYDLKEIVFLH